MKYGKYILNLIGVVVISLSGLAQDLHPILDRFNAIIVNGTVNITCVISSGSTCNGIDVLRSTDSLTFEVIGNIAGVCGSTSRPVTYQFEDQNPTINVPNYYKLELGGVGFTDPISVIIRNIANDKVQVAPNPSKGLTKIHFKNPVNNTFQLAIRNSNGQLVFSSNTTGNLFKVDVSNWKSGYYFIQLFSKDSNSSKSGVLVVSH